MKINLFKIQSERVDDFTLDIEQHDYIPVADYEENGYSMTLYLFRKSSRNQGWLDFYKPILEDEDYREYSEHLGSDTLSGIYLVEKDSCCYAVTHGQAHFIARQYCDKDFGLDLAERIIDPVGLKMKHSQTFTSNNKKDITSYTQRRKVDNSFDYGEAFSYVKCKTVNKKEWGETTDFGESVRFTTGKGFSLTAKSVFKLVDRIHNALSKEANIKLPRYRVVKDKATKDELEAKLIQQFDKYLTGVDVEDYWLTGVSFNFLGEYKYALKYKTNELIGICDTLNIEAIKKAITEAKEKIHEDYGNIRVHFYNEDDDWLYSRRLLELIQVNIDMDGKYYVLFHGEWVEFSESYVKFVEEQVDDISFEKKESFGLSETDLIAKLAASGDYTQLHKSNIYIGKYCVEQADLMDDNNVIMIKDQRNQADLVYLVRQATTSLRLTESRELEDNIFSGRNVCLWMIVKRKSLNKLSDFKSFHLLDALNDFKREVTNMNLRPVIWISLSN